MAQHLCVAHPTANSETLIVRSVVSDSYRAVIPQQLSMMGDRKKTKVDTTENSTTKQHDILSQMLEIKLCY